MASIEVIIRDDQGNVLSQSLDSAVNLPSLSLQGVETAVEDWRHRVLPKVELTLLELAQQKFTEAHQANSICEKMDTERFW
jgi:hypothetical protein